MGKYALELLAIACLGFVCIPYVHCLVGRFGVCEQRVTSFRVIYNIALSKCMSECDRREKCHRLNYLRRTKECRLYDTQSGTGNDVIQSCFIIKREELDRPGNCNNGETCEQDGSSSVEGECPVPKLHAEERGVIYGNVLSTGSKIKVVCKPDFFPYPSNEQVTCKISGEWDGLPKCVVNCSEPCPRFPYTKDVNPGGIHEGDTRTYECKPGFFVNNTAETSFNITCTVDQKWALPPGMCMNETVFPKHQEAIHYEGCYVYEVNKPFQIRVTYSQALQACMPYGQLAKLNTTEAQKRLRNYFLRELNYPHNTYWIQGVYDRNTGKVTFNDGTEATETFWSDIWPPISFKDGECLTLPHYTRFKWAVIWCNGKFGYVCEYI